MLFCNSCNDIFGLWFWRKIENQYDHCPRSKQFAKWMWAICPDEPFICMVMGRGWNQLNAIRILTLSSSFYGHFLVKLFSQPPSNKLIFKKMAMPIWAWKANTADPFPWWQHWILPCSLTNNQAGSLPSSCCSTIHWHGRWREGK